MSFSPEKLKNIRKSLGINKAEASRRLNMTAMGYGRYENGDRVPSYQTLCYIAQIFGTSVSYLCNETEDPSATEILVSQENTPELFELVQELSAENTSVHGRMLSYYQALKKISSEKNKE